MPLPLVQPLVELLQLQLLWKLAYHRSNVVDVVEGNTQLWRGRRAEREGAGEEFRGGRGGTRQGELEERGKEGGGEEEKERRKSKRKKETQEARIIGGEGGGGRGGIRQGELEEREEGRKKRTGEEAKGKKNIGAMDNWRRGRRGGWKDRERDGGRDNWRRGRRGGWKDRERDGGRDNWRRGRRGEGWREME